MKQKRDIANSKDFFFRRHIFGNLSVVIECFSIIFGTLHLRIIVLRVRDAVLKNAGLIMLDLRVLILPWWQSCPFVPYD